MNKRPIRSFMSASVLFLSAVMLSPGLIFAETEPNNDSSTANVLAINGSGSGTLSATDVVDWYVITIPSDGRLYVETNSDAAVEIDDRMYAMAGGKLEQVASYDLSWGTKDATHRNDLKAGTYYVTVGRYSGEGAYTISCQFTPSALANDQELNDSSLIALSLDTNKSATGHIGYYGAGAADNVDWWKITVYGDGKLAAITTSDSTAEIDLRMYDRNGTTEIAGYDTGWGIHEGTHFNNLTPGTYFIKVFRYSGYGSYTIVNKFTPTRLAIDAEPNDSAAAALALSPNNSSTGHIGFYTTGTIDNADWWKFTLPSDGRLVVNTVSDSTAEIDLRMYDEDKTTEIAGYDISWGINEATHRDNLMAGTYYVRVNKYSGYGSYSISNKYTPAAQNSDAEPNDSIPIAKPLTVGQIASGHLGYYRLGFTDSWDFFTFTVPAAWDTLFIRTVSDSTMELDLKLYNSQAAEIQSAGAWGIRELLVRSGTAAGTYTVGVKRYSGYGPYTILVSSTRPDSGQTPTSAMPSSERRTITLPAAFSISSTNPAPGSALTIVRFSIPTEGNARLSLYDVSGRDIRTIVNARFSPGSYQVPVILNTLANGCYLLRLKSGAFDKTEKFLVR
jgi:hypothetical protein